MSIESDGEIIAAIAKARAEIEAAGGEVTKIFVPAGPNGQAGAASRHASRQASAAGGSASAFRIR